MLIELTRGKFAQVDDIDADLAKFKWYPDHYKDGLWYAKRKLDRKHYQHEHMHRVILERMAGRPLLSMEQTDHINHDGLDNRRTNLRIASSLQNQRNKRKCYTIETASQYKGVVWDKHNRLWASQIKVNGKSVHLGRYDIETEAALAYDNAAREHFGEFLNLNFPDIHDSNPQKHIAPVRPHSSHYCGVSWLKRGERWCAYIDIDKKRFYLGYSYATEEDAARAYDVEARKIGRRTNFPEAP